jgi:hypothetical protein
LATIPKQGLIIAKLGEKHKVFSFFTDPYEDEILYSAIARYHYYYGNNNFKDTLFEIFGSENVVPTIEFPSKLEYLSQQFHCKKLYNSDYLILKHTLYPFYSPFIPYSRQVLIQNEVKYGDGKGIIKKGIIAFLVDEQYMKNMIPGLIEIILIFHSELNIFFLNAFDIFSISNLSSRDW